jgi:uncharacterized protein YbjT (DUF2867 family)
VPPIDDRKAKSDMSGALSASQAQSRNVFMTGGSGFMGRRLSAALVSRGHRVRALVRPGSEKKLAAGVEAVVGDALDLASYAAAVTPADTFVHLVGVSHPNPSKAEEFRAIDAKSAANAIAAALQSRVEHFVYVSVAQPAPIMQAYIAARAECEQALLASGLNATVLRPWYVLGPGRRWPLLLVPMYWILGAIPRTRESAQRLGLVTIDEMIAALLAAVERPAAGFLVLEVPDIRRAKRL